MTPRRHIHRLAFCTVCKKDTMHDEDGEGICLECMAILEQWIRDMDDARTKKD